jgi:hypothetical protein
MRRHHDADQVGAALLERGEQVDAAGAAEPDVDEGDAGV